MMLKRMKDKKNYGILSHKKTFKKIMKKSRHFHLDPQYFTKTFDNYFFKSF